MLPLPLVPATWMTGGRRCCGMAELVEQGQQPVQAEVDQPRMQAVQPGDDAVDAGGMGPPPSAVDGPRPASRHHAAASSLTRSRPISRASVSLQFGALDHHVDDAVLVQVFGALEPLGQFLPHRLLDHPRAGEADQRAGLGDLDVAQHGEAGGDAAGGGIGQHDDERQAGFLHQPRGDDRARHLHQADRALLHARAARGGEHDQRRLLQHRQPRRGDDALAHRGAHRAADELELHRRDDRLRGRRCCRARPAIASS